MANAQLDNISIPGVVNRLDLRFADGESVAILGPPRCGKSAILRSTVGLDPRRGGRIIVDGREIVAAPDPDVAIVLEGFALYPHLTAGDNVAFPLRMWSGGTRVVNERVDELAAILGFEDAIDKLPSELAACEQLCVAVARALARRPKLLLIDDPLATLAASDRSAFRAHLRNVQRTLRQTTLYATSSSEDAATLGDRIAILHDRVVHQIDTPSHVYRNPATRAVAAALGDPPINFFDGQCDGALLHIADQELDLGAILGDQELPRQVVVGVRPEGFDINGTRKNSLMSILDPSTRQCRGSNSIIEGYVGTLKAAVLVNGDPTDIPRRAYATPGSLLLFACDSGQRLR